MPDDLIKDAVDTSRRILGETTDFDADGKLPGFSRLSVFNHNTLSNFIMLAKIGLQCAEKIKYEFDQRWSPHWHVIVGRSFGSFVTHETKKFLFFYLEDKAIMLFKAG